MPAHRRRGRRAPEAHAAVLLVRCTGLDGQPVPVSLVEELARLVERDPSDVFVAGDVLSVQLDRSPSEVEELAHELVRRLDQPIPSSSGVLVPAPAVGIAGLDLEDPVRQARQAAERARGLVSRVIVARSTRFLVDPAALAAQGRLAISLEPVNGSAPMAAEAVLVDETGAPVTSLVEAARRQGRLDQLDRVRVELVCDRLEEQDGPLSVDVEWLDRELALWLAHRLGPGDPGRLVLEIDEEPSAPVIELVEAVGIPLVLDRCLAMPPPDWTPAAVKLSASHTAALAQPEPDPLVAAVVSRWIGRAPVVATGVLDNEVRCRLEARGVRAVQAPAVDSSPGISSPGIDLAG